MPAPPPRIAVGALALVLAALVGWWNTAVMAPLRPTAARTTAVPSTGTFVGASTVPPSTGSATASPGPSTALPSTALPPVVVVGLGDSVTSGYACHCTTFIDLYAAMLRERAGLPTEAVNFGVAGLTSASLSDQIAGAPVRAQLAHAGVVVVTIGANDLSPLIGRWQQGGCDSACVEPATAAMGARLSGVLAELQRLVPSGAHVLVTTYWNVFEDGDVADALYGNSFGPWSAGVTESANAQICSAAAQADDPCVDLYEPFDGAGDRNPTALLADDGDHPNAAGHQLIAETLFQADSLGAAS